MITGIRKSAILLALFTAVWTSVEVSAAGDDDATVVMTQIKQTSDTVIALLRDGTATDEQRRQRVFAAIDPVFDFALMAKLTLGRTYWIRFDAEQRKEFTQLFTDLIRETYFDKAGLITDQTVAFDAPIIEEPGKKIYIGSRFVSKDDEVTMVYKLAKRQDGWRVYDVEIAGISIVASYHSQYSEVLHGGTPEALLVKLREKVAAIAQ